jgi:hypothetical protein
MGELVAGALVLNDLYQNVWKGHNLHKIGKCCLDMELRFINASERALGLVHSAYNNCISTKKLDKDCLGPGASARVRVTKMVGDWGVGD